MEKLFPAAPHIRCSSVSWERPELHFFFTLDFSHNIFLGNFFVSEGDFPNAKEEQGWMLEKHPSSLKANASLGDLTGSSELKKKKKRETGLKNDPSHPNKLLSPLQTQRK